MGNNEDYILGEIELDAIGEVMNISMGSAATAMSTMLDRKVNITTPEITNVDVSDFNFDFMHPVVGVEIKYVEGIDGVNVLILREADVAKIVGHLLCMDPEEMDGSDEIGQSAICEIMNQMMGSSASALATFLGKSINISPPQILTDVESENIRDLFGITGDSIVSIKFKLVIDGLVESEFLSALEPKLARDIVEVSMRFNDLQGEEEIVSTDKTAVPIPAAQSPPQSPPPQSPPQQMEAMYTEVPQGSQGAVPPAAQPVYAQAPPGYPVIPGVPQDMAGQMPMGMPGMPPIMPGAPGMPTMPGAPGMAVQQNSMPPGYMPYPQQGYMMPPAYQAGRVATSSYTYKTIGGDGAVGDQDNLDLVMTVPIQISVELGRTKKKIKDIADLGIGNIVELDRQAGDQVDVIANGKLIARGDVVVVDDNYSVRITEIVRQPEESV